MIKNVYNLFFNYIIDIFVGIREIFLVEIFVECKDMMMKCWNFLLDDCDDFKII